MAIRSILFGTSDGDAGSDARGEPEHFQDLNLDQIVRAAAKAGGVPGLPRYFHRPLRDAGLVGFRQQIFRELEDPAVREVAERFTASMAGTRRRLEALERRKHPPQAHRWFLEIVLDHAAAVTGLVEGLEAAGATAAGLRALRDDVAEHTRTAAFTGVREQALRLRERLGEVRYDLLVRGDRITVAEHDPDGRFDYAQRVLATFDRFRQRSRQDRRGEPRPEPGLGLDFVEAGVLDLVVELCPGVFRDLAAFFEANRGFVADEITRVDHELRFYLGYLSYLAPLRVAGLPICYPVVSGTDKTLVARDVYDLALAAKLTGEDGQGGRVVGNDLSLDAAERVLVVSGPNQGGKTTLSRAFGQLYHLAALGCPVPGRDVRIFLPDRILTHYERAERHDALASKLEEELLRMRALLDRATPDSVIVLNEIFTSTTPDDARALSERVLAAITRLDVPCLWVSFVDELSLLSPKAVSMVGTVADDGRATRTYKVVRRAADGRAHALALAERHGLTYAQLTERVRR
ncbi:MutS-related protein [Actinomadura rugatobispora]|uniref:DNA mismatch repair proteins mutS family domain-containing protein n=1 Tax=Actinomadura rugatobispora TaxID=1994 RepID=A0ABW1A9M5_9ACTN|nr:DNA mismatch repair protein MutS [Actinomadura rugatobispora]